MEALLEVIRTSERRRPPPEPLDFAWGSWRLGERQLGRLAWQVSSEVVLRSDERGIELGVRAVHDVLLAELQRRHVRLVRNQTEVLESLGARLPAAHRRRLSKDLAHGAAFLGPSELSELGDRLAAVLVEAAPPGFLSVEELRSLPTSIVEWITDTLGPTRRG